MKPSYNPEKRAWRGRSYKKHGEPIAELRGADAVKTDLHEEQIKRGRLHEAMVELAKEHGHGELVWMLGQVLDDRGLFLKIDTGQGSGPDVTGEELRNARLFEEE